MARDDFSLATKRTLAQRSGGRCSKPGCDKLCWLPGEGPDKAASVGVAAHIHAASPEGPRYKSSQNSAERKDITNAIYLCQIHAHEIDCDESRFPSKLLFDWKQKHEAQIIGQADGKWLLPEISIKKGIGVTISATERSVVTEKTIGNVVEHTITIRNSSDYEVRRIGFTIQYPEFIEHPPKIAGPPGFDFQLHCENMEWEASVTGSGKVETPKVTHYGSFTLEGTSLIQGQSISILIRSIPDPIPQQQKTDKSIFWVCGELGVNTGSMLEKQTFVTPLIYDSDNRDISCGFVHTSDPNSDEYVNLYRAYFV